MPTPYIGRLAPSPTGLLHLGHARSLRTLRANGLSAAEVLSGF